MRIAHWLVALALFILVLSGLQIFNAHPALYWGSASTFDRPFLTIGPFPHWLTLPSYQDLAGGRRWHFFFTWLLLLGLGLYFLANAIRKRLKRDLLPTGRQLRGIGSSIAEHLKLRFPHGEEARHYNILQKLSYLGVMFGLIPLVILTGLALAPAIDAAVPWLLILFGGRQSARTLHFIGTVLLVSFFFVHILMVVAAGPINEMRSIITGWFVIRSAPNEPSKTEEPSS